MELFHGCKSVGDVKRRYRYYAPVLHPDTGGADWAFLELQTQYTKAKQILKTLGNKRQINAYNQAVQARQSANPHNSERQIWITEEMQFALENLTLVERHFWQALNRGVYGTEGISAWDFCDWLNRVKEFVRARERHWADQREAARRREEPPTLEQWIDQCGGVDAALAELEDF